ncbi:Leucine--tRNA ligase [Podosphaera aphanis]|nr:Leucine--tRNA ligase [Podosphaera aphanis]
MSNIKFVEGGKKCQAESLNRAISYPRPEEENPQQKMFILPMFPYPSGDLHLGHLRVYTISDVLARFYQMQGRHVIHPIGWDAFGLPAENAAIERGIDPKAWTKHNIQRMRAQLENMNGRWDWDREFATCDPSFYKHTQKLFILLLKAGLAYQAESVVNYDPVDKTVLANEQVDANGLSWRSGAKVEKKKLKQWFFKISEYRQELLEGLETLERNGAWPTKVLAMQKNWLGKSTGARIRFSIDSYDDMTPPDIEVFTTRLDTLYGVQYIALTPSHPIVQCISKRDVNLQSFLNNLPALPKDSKDGYLLPKLRAVNPLAFEESTPDATKADLFIFVAPYVLDYGEGAVMGVPAHDKRDHAFWKHNNPDGPVRVVISQAPDDERTRFSGEPPFTSQGYLTSRCGPFAGMESSKAAIKILELLQPKGRGSPAEVWKLRDWLVSRQRYWGTPIPIIHCNTCGPVSVPDQHLPVELPDVSSHWQNGQVGNPLESAHEWMSVECPQCGAAAKRDTDTMDTFVDSSWYFMRFLDPHNESQMFASEAANEMLPVDIYVGGVEHAILHLLYARFISKFLVDKHMWSSGCQVLGEPFKILLAQGMVHGKTYTDPATGRFLKPHEVNLSDPNKPLLVASGEAPNVSFEKMSKSKYNGVDPSMCREKYGADALRAHILFQAPITEVLEWNEEKISGITRWLRRLHDFISDERDSWLAATAWEQSEAKCPKDILEKLVQIENLDTVTPAQNYCSNGSGKVGRSTCPVLDNDSQQLKELWRSVQSTIVKVTKSYSITYSLNTVVSDLMSLTNKVLETPLLKQKGEASSMRRMIIYCSLQELIKMMAPITPVFAENCWALLQPEDLPESQVHADTSAVPCRGHSAGTRHQRLGLTGSVFSQRFPSLDGTLEILTPKTQNCAVQINGRLRVVVEIPTIPEDLTDRTTEQWITDEILSTAQGKAKLTSRQGSKDCGQRAQKNGPSDLDIRRAKKIIVVKGGKTVNYVL